MRIAQHVLDARLFALMVFAILAFGRLAALFMPGEVYPTFK